jgi:hypothetical protein
MKLKVAFDAHAGVQDMKLTEELMATIVAHTEKYYVSHADVLKSLEDTKTEVLYKCFF